MDIFVVLFDGIFCGCFSSYDLAKTYIEKDNMNMSLYEIITSKLDLLTRIKKFGDK